MDSQFKGSSGSAHKILPSKTPLEEQSDEDEDAPVDMEVDGMSMNPIDEILHHRQLAVYGRETMRRFSTSKVLVSRLQGLGAEIAKNLILAGVNSVTLHDEELVELWDLSSCFQFSEVDVGKNRALASVQKLQELNNSVKVSILTTELTKENLSQFQAVVFTDISLEKAIEFDEYCHHHDPPIAFIKTEVRGLFGSVFCDFGPQFTVVDVDGEEPHTGIIVSISNENPALIKCVPRERLEFQDGDLVLFSEVEGMTALNSREPRKIKNASHNSFTLNEDTTNYGAYERGGIVTQVKQPKQLHFKPLSEALKNPGDFLLSDFSKADRPPLLHLAFQALDKFRAMFGRFPVAGSEDDAQKLISIFNSINDSCADGKVEEIDKNLLHYFACGAKAVLNPMAAMFGGIVGQEVLKACSGKFHPLFQFFYFDSVESLPTKCPSADDVRPQNSRYDAQMSVFGSKLQKELEMAKVFIVGAGALGCEFLKNAALMGVSCGDHGKLTITDDDVIEKSNLSTQFLFRDCNIGQAKSIVAASTTAAKAINPGFHIEALQNRAGPETENVFNDSFWENLNVVINALDNVDGRLYIDQRCLYFGKSLLESGTHGAKCNTQMVIPHLSENYGASHDPPEKKASSWMDPDLYFPYNIDDCITWARSEFEGLLEMTPPQANCFLEHPEESKSVMEEVGDYEAKGILERVVECLIDKGKCETFEDCITWARLKFEDYFVDRIKQLTLTYPREALTRYEGNEVPFWSAPKRFPRPLEFSVKDPSHLRFVKAAAVLRAETFGIPKPDWIMSSQKLVEIVNGVIVPEFQPKVVSKVIDLHIEWRNVAKNNAADVERLIARLEECLSKLPQGFKMNPIRFQMHDENNSHMEMITWLANMSARNYGIPEVDKLKAKLIAGRKIPAIATSTAVAAGLACLELYKFLDKEHNLADYRNAFANLALPLFVMAEPAPAKVTKHQNMSWTAWNRWTYEGNPTLEELLDWLLKKGLTVISITYRDYLLHVSIFPNQERMGKKLRDLVRELDKADLPSYRKHVDLVVSCEGIKIPQVSVYFR